jgi:hypothetical protein
MVPMQLTILHGGLASLGEPRAGFAIIPNTVRGSVQSADRQSSAKNEATG